MKMKKYCPYCMAPIKDGEPCPACGLTEGSYSPAPHHLPPGTILMERYLVGRVLGEGGFGITYIGCDLRLEMKVAIKEYFPTERVTRTSSISLAVSNFTGVSEDAYRQSKSKFLREARAMARMIKQPEIVGVRDYFEANNTAYIVMEFIDGTTMKTLVEQRGGRIPAGELLHMMEPIFGALDVMHSAGLLHRDISPENLMLENGSIRLLDFGCARDGAAGLETLTISLKYGYAPVEQYQSKGQGPWTDVYALAATIYFCLTGKRPPQSMDRLVEDDLILPRKLGVDLTEKQERALLYGMGIHPRRRFRSIQEFHAALYEGVDWKGSEAEEAEKNTASETSGRHGKSTTTETSGKTITPENTGRTTPAVKDNKTGNKTPSGTPVHREDSADMPAWRTWITEHRTVAGAGAAAIAAILLLTVSLNVATKPKNTEPVSAPAETESMASEAFETDSAAETGNESGEESENETTGAAEPDTETDGIAIDEATISAGIQSSREDEGTWLTSAEGDSLTLTLDTSVLEGLEYDSINWEVGDDASTGNGADADSYSENGNVLTLYGPEMYAQYESDGGLNVFWEVLGTDENNDTYVMYGGSVWVEIQAAEESSDTAAAAYTVDSETAEQRRSEMEELFTDAQTLTGELTGSNEEDFYAMLEDDSVSAIRVTASAGFITSEPVTITKPVILESGAFFGSYASVTIDGENACLYLDEGAETDPALLRIVNGGRIVIDDSCVFNPQTIVWLESETDLELLGSNGYTTIDERTILVFNATDTFSQSAEVSTAEEFLSALNDGTVSSITVTGEITLDLSDDSAASARGTSEDGSTFLYVNVPVCISEGAALRVTGTKGDGDYLDNEAYFDTNAILVNYGTMDMDVNTNSALLLNCGSWQGGVFNHISPLVNQGDMTLTMYSTIDGPSPEQCGHFYNEGSVTITDSCTFNLGQGILYNRGVITVTGGNASMNFGAGVTVHNMIGEMHVEDDAELRNDAILENTGEIIVDGGRLYNDGAMYIYGGTMRQISGEVQNGGLILTDNINLELTDQPGRIESLPVDGSEGCRTVKTAAELQAAMNDDSVQSVYLTENDVTIDGDFTVTKPLVVHTSFLHVDGVLTVSGGYIQQLGGIGADSLVLEKDTLYIQWGKLLVNNVTVGENAAFYRWYTNYYTYYEYAYALLEDIEIASGGRLQNLSPMTLEDAAITIHTGGELISEGYLQLNGCTVNIESEGDLKLGGGYRFDQNTTVTNDGWLETGGFTDFIESQMAGTLTNNGSINALMNITGTVENNGHFYGNANVQDGGELLGNAVETLADNQDWMTGEISADE